MVTLSAISPIAAPIATPANRPTTLVESASRRVRQWSLAAWSFFESVGSVRAATELERQARGFESIDPARARILHEAAQRCLSKV